MYVIDIIISTSHTTTLSIEGTNIEIKASTFNLVANDTLTLSISCPSEPHEILEYKILSAI